jgi:hypothetical protein
MPPANPALDSIFTAQVDADDKNPLLLTNLTLIQVLVALIVNMNYVLPPEFYRDRAFLLDKSLLVRF